jgi:hypothetical protein
MMDKEFHKNNKKEKLLMNHFGELKCAQCWAPGCTVSSNSRIITWENNCQSKRFHIFPQSPILHTNAMVIGFFYTKLLGVFLCLEGMETILYHLPWSIMYTEGEKVFFRNWPGLHIQVDLPGATTLGWF